MAGRRNAANKRPSMFEVAKMAGVSHQTVSRVINHSPDVSDATREKVQRAIDELGYRPSNSARALHRAHRWRSTVLRTDFRDFVDRIDGSATWSVHDGEHGARGFVYAG